MIFPTRIQKLLPEPCRLTGKVFAAILDPFVMKSGAGQLRFSLPHPSSHDPHRDLDQAIADSSAAKRRYTLSSQGLHSTVSLDHLT